MTARGFTPAEIRETAVRTIIRMELGEYRAEGPRENILHLESWSSWNTLVNELTKEGYVLLTPAEYAEVNRVSGDRVDTMIRKEGTLFALLYMSGPQIHCAVPLNTMEPPEGMGPFPTS